MTPVAAGAAVALAGSVVGMTVSALLGSPWPFVVFLVLSLLAEVLLGRHGRPVARVLARAHLGYAFRFGTRGLLSAVLLCASSVLSLRIVVALVLVEGVLLGLRLVEAFGTYASERRLRHRQVGWRDLAVAGVRLSDRIAPRLRRTARRTLLFVDAVAHLGLAVVVAGAPWWVFVVAAVPAIAVTGGFAVLASAELLRLRSDSSNEELAAAVAAALGRLAPEVVVYFSRPEANSYILDVWTPTLAQVHQRTLVVVRERAHLTRARGDGLPMVYLGPSGLLEQVLPPSVKVALYPTNVAKNGHLLRLTGIRDVFVGHGDSDKGGSATTLTRVFDEVWVSGPAARDRYRVADVGVRDEQVREIGRPQLAGVAHLTGDGGVAGAPERDLTVLYAPTREGFYAEWNYSSVLVMGERLVSALLATDGVRVVYKPHPGTGTDDPDHGVAAERIADLVRAAGAPHRVATREEDLYEVFNESDLLVSDISSVITDFLASGKPYVVTNPTAEPAADFMARFPSAGGAALLGPDLAGLDDVLADARGPDLLRGRREEVAGYLLGDTSGDLVARFEQALQDCAERQRRDDARPRPDVAVA